MIDSIIVRAQHKAPTRKKRVKGPDDRAKQRRTVTKIHAMPPALGNPLAFFADKPMNWKVRCTPPMQADTLLADKAFDPDHCVIEPLLRRKKSS
jgi:hypothetical protein